MTKSKTEQRLKHLKHINYAFAMLIIPIAATVFSLLTVVHNSCVSCFLNSTIGNILYHALVYLAFSYMIFLPIMLYYYVKVRQSKKDDSESDGGFAY